MLSKVIRTISGYNMFSRGDRVLVGLSGGPDSVCLLYMLMKIAPQYGLKLYIAHLNHGIRGKESDADQVFCEKVGEKFGIEVFSKKVKIKKNENSARNARYGFLEETALKIGAKKIALGHNADDQAETVLMRLIRGAGAKGMGGIPPVRSLERILIVRPLIDIFRDEIISFLKERRIAYRIDSTNKKTDYLRNKIRHELIPFLAKYNPNIKSALFNAARNMALLDDYINTSVFKITNGRLKININELIILHPVLKQEVIRSMARGLEPDLSLTSEQVSNILSLTGNINGSKRLHLPKGVVVEREYNNLAFRKGCGKNKTFKAVLPINGMAKIEECNILITSKLRKKSKKILRKPFEVEMDYDKISHLIGVRSRRSGDVFRPLGLNGKKKVKDIFIDLKISKAERGKIPLVVSGKEICWIPGYRIGENFKIDDGTKNVVRLKIVREN